MQAAREVSVGRGVLYLSGAKLYFILVSFLLPVVLPRLLGDVGFGAYTVVVTSVSLFTNVIVTGTIQAVSRFTAADLSLSSMVKAAGLRMHLLVGLPLALLLALGAPWIAHLYHDPDKAGPLALAAAIPALYAFYSVFVGSANGTRAFHKQAGLDATATTLRVSGILGAAALGLGVYGAMGAWVIGAATVLFVSILWVGLPDSWKGGEIKPLVRFLGQVGVYLALTNVMLLLDGLLLKRLVAEWFHAHPDAPVVAGSVAAEADRQVAYYAAAQNLGRLPYQLLLAVTFIIFPLISSSTFEKDEELTRRYVRTTLRYSLIAAALLGVMFAGNAAANIRFIYPTEYGVASPALVALAMSAVALTLFSVAGTMLNGGGHTRDAIAAAAVTVVLLVTAILVVVPRTTPGSEMLMMCAAMTATATFIGAVISIALVWRRYRATLPALTVVRVALAIAAGCAVGYFMPARGKIIGLAETVACGVVYLAALVATGELRRDDLRVLLKRK